MRPIHLTMTAFGSFAEETAISFEDFASGLYLVVGETGAGKTTIFDAIVFALFGKASGTNRDPAMMHSDYVPKSVDTVVTLRFSHAGKQYEVRRSIHFRKKRGSENEYSDGIFEAEMLLPEGAPIRGHRPVTARCEELLGLNAEQFRQIIMLAQGEFREFLSADSSKKSEILGRLFDSSEYIRYQNLLGTARNELSKRRQQAAEDIKNTMEANFLPPEPGEEAAIEPYLPDAPGLLKELDRLIARDRTALETLSGAKDASQQAVEELNRRLGAAEGSNQLLDELASVSTHQNELAQRQAEMTRLREQCGRVERALRNVQPLRERWHRARSDSDRTRTEIRTLSESVQSYQNQLSLVLAAVDADAAGKARIQALARECERIEESLPRYTQLAETETQFASASTEADALRVRQDAIAKQQAVCDQRMEDVQRELTLLDTAELEVLRTENAYAAAKESAETLTGENGIQAETKAVLGETQQLEADQKELAALTSDASAAERAWHEAYQRFISGQAGILGSELEAELRDSGRAVCRVCGTEFHTGQPHHFALRLEGTPSQEEVDEKRNTFDLCEQARSETARRTDLRQQEIAHRKSALLDKVRSLLPDCESWEKLTGNEYLSDAALRFSQERKAAEAAYQTACQNRERKRALEQELSEVREKQSRLSQEREVEATRLQALQLRLSALETAIAGLREHLPFPSRTEAEEKLLTFSQERMELQEQLDAHQAALERVRELLNQTRGELSGKEKALPEQLAVEVKARLALEDSLSDNQFADMSAVDDALAIPGDEDGSAWLNRQREMLSAFQNDRKNTEERLELLKTQTEGLVRVSLQELQQDLSQARERAAADLDAFTERERLLENHVRVRETVWTSQNELARTEAAWLRLDKLATLALGASSEGGKLSFERYVMGSIFREVLEMANLRLDVMSGGRYALVHTIQAGRANAVAGLEIEVLDAATGKQRPASSLSGGESFQVSLSLALGLSDVVMSRAGGMGLDTIFIDEGFGSLDDSALDNAIAVLNQLTEGNRLVGVISHLDKLEESIPQKLRVRKTAQGSVLRFEVS